MALIYKGEENEYAIRSTGKKIEEGEPACIRERKENEISRIFCVNGMKKVRRTNRSNKAASKKKEKKEKM